MIVLKTQIISEYQLTIQVFSVAICFFIIPNLNVCVPPLSHRLKSWLLMCWYLEMVLRELLRFKWGQRTALPQWNKWLYEKNSVTIFCVYIKQQLYKHKEMTRNYKLKEYTLKYNLFWSLMPLELWEIISSISITLPFSFSYDNSSCLT